jgi:hypothetical protein
MAYDLVLADHIRAILADRPHLVAKKMFGGIGFMLNGNMACGVSGNALMARVGPGEYESALNQPHVRVFPSAGRPMRGWLLVDPAGLATDADLEYWVRRGAAVAESLPPK